MQGTILFATELYDIYQFLVWPSGILLGINFLSPVGTLCLKTHEISIYLNIEKHHAYAIHCKNKSTRMRMQALGIPT